MAEGWVSTSCGAPETVTVSLGPGHRELEIEDCGPSNFDVNGGAALPRHARSLCPRRIIPWRQQFKNEAAIPIASSGIAKTVGQVDQRDRAPVEPSCAAAEHSSHRTVEILDECLPAITEEVKRSAHHRLAPASRFFGTKRRNEAKEKATGEFIDSTVCLLNAVSGDLLPSGFFPCWEVMSFNRRGWTGSGTTANPVWA